MALSTTPEKREDEQTFSCQRARHYDLLDPAEASIALFLRLSGEGAERIKSTNLSTIAKCQGDACHACVPQPQIRDRIPPASEMYGPDPYDINFCFPYLLEASRIDGSALVPFMPRLHAEDRILHTFQHLAAFQYIRFPYRGCSRACFFGSSSTTVEIRSTWRMRHFTVTTSESGRPAEYFR